MWIYMWYVFCVLIDCCLYRLSGPCLCLEVVSKRLQNWNLQSYVRLHFMNVHDISLWIAYMYMYMYIHCTFEHVCAYTCVHCTCRDNVHKCCVIHVYSTFTVWSYISWFVLSFSTASIPSIPQGFGLSSDVLFAKVQCTALNLSL